MRLTMASKMPCTKEFLWEQLADTSTFRRVSAPFMVFRSRDSGGFPHRWMAGNTYGLSMYLLGYIPLGRHEITVLDVDREARRLSTSERGQLIREWRHTMQVAEDARGDVVFRDELNVRSGLATPLIIAGAYFFFVYRHWRIKRLLRDGKLSADR
ncbi:hypothetical protein [Paenibacillus methanolicus]|uniref:hypothetical protein n=1 Tax=Paenibacillus methanolicus TaxID=582686 RepID=UPI0011E6AB8F|nr:hypothetical protein [Paenibacillus methanolicus]